MCMLTSRFDLPYWNRTKVLCRNFSGALSKLYCASQAASRRRSMAGCTWAVILSSCSPAPEKSLDQKITAPHTDGVRGGCSPQNNLYDGQLTGSCKHFYRTTIL